MPPSSDHLPEAMQALKSVLEREKAEGTERIFISTDSLQKLRELPSRIQQARSAAVAAPVPTPTPTPEPVRESIPEPALSTPPEKVERPALESPVLAETRETGNSELRPLGTTKAEKIAWLAQKAEQCEECRGLGTLRDVMVFSVGNPDADLMFVGEAPGFEEENQREPFVGPAGRKLTQIIQAMGLKRPENVYISNIVKFRPIKGNPRFQGQQNRKPEPREMAAAVKYVLAEIEVVQPKVIVALGATAAEGLLELSGSIARLRNQFHDLNGVPVMVTYHPSYLLRSESNSPDGGKSEKRKVWEDMLMVMDRLGLPISDKQQGYFL